MKIDFRKAVKELRLTEAFQVANMHANLVQDIVSGIQNVIQPALENASLPSLTGLDSTKDSSLASTLQMNTIATDPTLISMQQQITQLTELITQMGNNQENNQGQFQQQQQHFQHNNHFQGRFGRGCGCERGRGRGRRYGRGQGRGRGRYKQQQQISFIQNNPNPFQHYPQASPRCCWSHGMCGHTSNICNTLAPGHCWEATAENRMDRSTREYNQ